MVYSFITLINLISYQTTLDLAFGGFTILGILLIISGAYLKHISKKFVLLTQFGEDEYQDMFEALKMLPQSELGMLQELTADIGYNPKFTMVNKCSQCATELRNDIPVNDIVFFVTPPTPVDLKK